MLVTDSDGNVAGPDRLLWARRVHDEAVFLEADGPTWTWRTVAAGAAEVAAKLSELDGERVALSAPNGGALVAAMFGIWAARGVPCLVSTKLPAAERAAVMQVLEPRHEVVIDAPAIDADIHLAAMDLLRGSSHELRVPGVWHPEADGLVLCTSGTTGLPKPVVTTMRGVWGMIDGITQHPVDPWKLSDPDGRPRRVESKPMVHIGSILALMLDMWRGRCTVIMDRFDPLQFAQIVRDHQLDEVSMVPSMLRMVLDAEVGRLNPPVKLVTTGTAALPDALRAEFEEKCGVPIQLTYGQTEAGTIAYEPAEDVLTGNRRKGTSGKVVPNIDVEVRDDSGAVLPIGEEGAIWIRGESIRPSVIGADQELLVDGWLDTGDSGHVDEDRYIYITGRRRDLIIRGGLKVVPAEVERALLDHPDVVEAVVAGVPDERLGEVPMAWIRVTPGAQIRLEVLRDRLREVISAYKVPVAIRVVAEFPRTETGKVRKDDLTTAAMVTAEAVRAGS